MFFTVNGPRSGVSSVIPSGFTVVAPILTTTQLAQQGSGYSGTGSRIIYVSSSTGSDLNTGTQISPVATIAHGVTLLRTDHADQLLLKCGDTWTNDVVGGPHLNGLTPSGSVGGTMTGFMLFGTYGTGNRPIVQANATTIVAAGGIFGNSAGGGGGTFGNNWAIIGWELYAYTRDPNNAAFSNTDAQNQNTIGFLSQNTITNTLVEDCYIHHFGVNLSFIPNGVTGLTIRRNIITDAYNSTARSQGIFLDGNTNVLLEQNFSDHNGYNNSILISPPATATAENHNFYIQVTNSNVTATNNVSTNASGNAWQFRSGGSFTENLMSNNPTGFNFGTNGGTVQNNVVLAATTFGLNIIFTGQTPTIVNNNIVANAASGSPAGSIGIDAESGTGTFTITSPTVTSVGGGAIGNINAEYPAGGAVTSPSLPAGTTILAQPTDFPSTGGTGTVVMSANATASGPAAFTTHPSNVTVSNNIVFAQNSVYVDGGINTTLAANNVFDYTGSNSGSAPEPFPSPTNSVGSYAGTIGLTATLAGFTNAARARQVGVWPTNLTAVAVNTYIRAGFGR